ncbi:MAG TPA: DUF2071 domain-containing protein [Gemmatimonadaceae bacterium]|nr:DUF2071 domain-containing protein [Gemmatimonadaceae bacterium]
MTGKFLTADWRYVAMLNYVVDPEMLVSHVPRGTELESHGGRHFISLVGFLFLDTHLFGLPAFFHRNFEEVNLRFYVRRKVEEEYRAGVVFIRELVSLPLVSELARLAYNESYRTVPMQHRLVETNGRLQSVEYQFGRPRDQCRLAVHVNGDAREVQRGSDEDFLSDRDWGYTRQRDGGTIEYRVEHPNWRVWSDARWELDGPLGEFYDAPFADILSGVPASASVSEGSAVAVHLPERVA